MQPPNTTASGASREPSPMKTRQSARERRIAKTALRSKLLLAPSLPLAPPSSSVDLPSTEPPDNLSVCSEVKNEKPASDTEMNKIPATNLPTEPPPPAPTVSHSIKQSIEAPDSSSPDHRGDSFLPKGRVDLSTDNGWQALDNQGTLAKRTKASQRHVPGLPFDNLMHQQSSDARHKRRPMLEIATAEQSLKQFAKHTSDFHRRSIILAPPRNPPVLAGVSRSVMTLEHLYLPIPRATDCPNHFYAHLIQRAVHPHLSPFEKSPGNIERALVCIAREVVGRSYTANRGPIAIYPEKIKMQVAYYWSIMHNRIPLVEMGSELHLGRDLFVSFLSTFT